MRYSKIFTASKPRWSWLLYSVVQKGSKKIWQERKRPYLCTPQDKNAGSSLKDL
jgi:hypothetical protein